MKADALSRTIQDICTQDTARLTAALALDFSGARIEVQCLLQAVLQVNRAYLLTHPEQRLNAEQHAQYMALFERRLSGEPIAYILGKREFFGLMFKVIPDTLIPRPETELLVEMALARLPPPSDETTSHSTRPSKDDGQVAGYPGLTATLSRERERGWGRGSKFRVLDLGTGSGAIALAIAHARPAAEVLACDASLAALEVARENAQRLGVTNAAFVQSDWFTALGGQRFDLIVSNPPYIAARDPHLQSGDVRFEPSFALASGDDGLHNIRCIVSQAKTHLACGGWLLLEHGYNQAAQVRELLRQAGFDEVFSVPDLAGIERVSGGRA
ncbi:MAG: peptide chain release factor N(5)-glutamine methyltransferase [Betaproteobacteria bacterium]|nr:peptide chain release factor N(5)-glutamine methyltransferase [Betaproteobacteria bacterium]